MSSDDSDSDTSAEEAAAATRRVKQLQRRSIRNRRGSKGEDILGKGDVDGEEDRGRGGEGWRERGGGGGGGVSTGTCCRRTQRLVRGTLRLIGLRERSFFPRYPHRQVVSWTMWATSAALDACLSHAVGYTVGTSLLLNSVCILLVAASCAIDPSSAKWGSKDGAPAGRPTELCGGCPGYVAKGAKHCRALVGGERGRVGRAARRVGESSKESGEREWRVGRRGVWTEGGVVLAQGLMRGL